MSPCTVSYHHESHDSCPGRDGTTCMEPTCYETATTGFVGRKPDADDLTYRTCSVHKMPVALGLVRFGLIAEADFEGGVTLSTFDVPHDRDSEQAGPVVVVIVADDSAVTHSCGAVVPVSFRCEESAVCPRCGESL